MKKILLLISFSVMAFAQAAPVSLNYNGSGKIQQTVNLLNTITRYRQESYIGTCYRQEPYQVYECNDYDYNEFLPISKSINKRCVKVPGRGPVCDNDPRPRPRPRPIPRRVCRYVTYYRSISYSCTKYRQVPYTVDLQITAYVKLDVEDHRDYRGSMAFNLNILENNQAKIAVSNSRSNETMVVTNLVTKLKQQNGDSRVVLVKGQIKLFNANAFQKPFNKGVSSIKLSTQNLKFNTGIFSNDFPVQIHVKITRRGSIFRKRETVLNRTFNSSEISSTENSGTRSYSLNLPAQGVSMVHKKKYDVVISLSALISGTVLNQPNGKLKKSSIRNKIKI